MFAVGEGLCFNEVQETLMLLVLVVTVGICSQIVLTVSAVLKQVLLLQTDACQRKKKNVLTSLRMRDRFLSKLLIIKHFMQTHILIF